MPIFKVVGEQIESGEKKTFFYDSLSTMITEEAPETAVAITDVDLKSEARKNGPFKIIKIQLGLSCNYSCSYCSQRFVEHAPETNKHDIAQFLDGIRPLPKADGLKFEFWGGEPFVYWKTMKPLAEALRAEYPEATFSVITNGSLLTRDIVDWLFDLGFAMAISHDGPGQHVRGDDPLDDNRDAIEYAMDKLLAIGKFSFNAVLNKQNYSRLAIIEFFEEKFPGRYIPHYEMNLIDAYDEGGLSSLDISITEMFSIRRQMWSEFRFIKKVGEHCPAQVSSSFRTLSNVDAKHNIGQKCGMDLPDRIAVDLRGNITTCQNVSAAATAMNGEAHKIGHVDDLDSVRLKTATHWSHRDACRKCPVVALCKGSCMFLEDEYFKASCEAAYSNNVVNFALGFEQQTGFVPVFIDSDDLPTHRKDIWGSILEHKDVKPKRVIKIKSE